MSVSSGLLGVAHAFAITPRPPAWSSFSVSTQNSKH